MRKREKNLLPWSSPYLNDDKTVKKTEPLGDIRKTIEQINANALVA